MNFLCPGTLVQLVPQIHFVSYVCIIWQIFRFIHQFSLIVQLSVFQCFLLSPIKTEGFDFTQV